MNTADAAHTVSISTCTCGCAETASLLLSASNDQYISIWNVNKLKQSFSTHQLDTTISNSISKNSKKRAKAKLKKQISQSQSEIRSDTNRSDSTPICTVLNSTLSSSQQQPTSLEQSLEHKLNLNPSSSSSRSIICPLAHFPLPHFDSSECIRLSDSQREACRTRWKHAHKINHLVQTNHTLFVADVSTQITGYRG
jgi:hypothetical protein